MTLAGGGLPHAGAGGMPAYAMQVPVVHNWILISFKHCFSAVFQKGTFVATWAFTAHYGGELRREMGLFTARNEPP